MKLDDATAVAHAVNAFQTLASVLDPSYLLPEWRAKLSLADDMHRERAARYCRLMGAVVGATHSRALRGANFLAMPAFEKMWNDILAVSPEAAQTDSGLHNIKRLIRLIAECLDLPVVGIAAADTD